MQQLPTLVLWISAVRPSTIHGNAVRTDALVLYIVHSPTNALLLNLEKSNLLQNTHNYRSYMFRSSTIIRELVQSLAKVIFLLKTSVKLCHCILCGDVAACHETACCCFLCTLQSAQQTAHKPFHDMLPHLHTIYNYIILPSVLTEI